MGSNIQPFCPPGTIYDSVTEDCNFSLADIATMQQTIANNANKGFPNKGLDPLRQGKFSFDSNPTTPPWVNMPDGGFPFSSNGTINTPVAPSGFVDVIGPNGQYTFQIPNGYDGVIKILVCFYNGGGFISGSGALIWRILINGQAVRNYDNILVQLGVPPFPGSTEGIRFKSGDTIQFQVDNVSLGGGGTQIFCFFGGWFYPSKLS